MKPTQLVAATPNPLHRTLVHVFSALSTALLSTLMLAGVSAFASAADSSDIRKTLFAEATGALQAANNARSSLLAPIAYSQGSEYYRKAEELLNEGASKKAERAATRFTAALAARAAAEDAKAETYAGEDWNAGEVALAEAAQRLENDRESSAMDYAATAEEKFRSGELVAIKSTYLNETRDLLAQAKKLRADRYASKTYADATRLLSQAETQLEEDRYDTDRPRNLARQVVFTGRARD